MRAGRPTTGSGVGNGAGSPSGSDCSLAGSGGSHAGGAYAGDAYGEAGKKKQAALHVHLAGSHYRAVLPGHAPGKDEL